MERLATAVEKVAAILGAGNRWGLVRQVWRLQQQRRRLREDVLMIDRKVGHFQRKVERLAPPEREGHKLERREYERPRHWPFLESEEP